MGVLGLGSNDTWEDLSLGSNGPFCKCHMGVLDLGSNGSLEKWIFLS